MLFSFFILMGGCAEDQDTAKAVLPEDTTPLQAMDSGTPFFSVDTSGLDSGFNEDVVM
jgi:hypothetical protein